MARRDWQNVAAPDFSPSIQGIQVASNLLARAGESAQTAFKGVDERLGQQEQAELARRFAALQTSEAATAAGADGSIFAGLNRLRAEDINQFQRLRTGLQQYEGEGQSQRIRGAQEERNTTEFSQKQGDRAARQAVNDVQAQIEQLTYEGKHADAAKLRQESAPLYAALEAGDARNARRDVRAVDAERRQGRYQDQAYNIAGWNQDRVVEGYNDGKAIDNQIIDLVRKGASWEDAEASLLGAGLGASQTLAALNRAKSMFDPLAAASSGGGGATAPEGGYAGGASDSTRVLNYTARNAGFGAVPDNIKTLGDLESFGSQVLRAGAESSAAGTFQITRDTLRDFGPRVLGANWKDQPLTAENEDKIARAIFESSKGSATALRNRWVSLNPQEAERVRKLPWEQARVIIAQGESGANLRALSPTQLTSNAVAVDAGRANAADRYRPLVANAGEALNSTASLPEVVSRMTGKDGQFASVGARRYSSLVQSVIDDSGGRLNPATASEVVNNNLRGRGWLDNTWVGGIARAVTGSGAGDTYNVDRQGLRADAARVASAGFRDDVNTDAARQQANANVQALAPRIESLRAQVQQAVARDQRLGQPNNPSTLARAQALAQLEQQYQQALAVASGTY